MSGNPFESTTPTGMVVQTVNASDRCEMVKSFTRAQCEAAMRHACLQVTVYQAIQRRLRQLERERLELAS